MIGQSRSKQGKSRRVLSRGTRIQMSHGQAGSPPLLIHHSAGAYFISRTFTHKVQCILD